MDPEAFVTSEAQGRRIRQAGYVPPRPVPEPPKAEARPVVTPDGVCRVIVCEICRERIARVYESVTPLTYPMAGGMFQGLAGPVGPWHRSLTWVDIRCPVCHHRPFILPDRVITTDGPYDLPIRDGADLARCECGRPLLAPNGGKPVCRYHGTVEPWKDEERIGTESKESLMTTSAVATVGEGPASVDITSCPVCGKPVNGEMGLRGHKRHCKGKENT